MQKRLRLQRPRKFQRLPSFQKRLLLLRQLPHPMHRRRRPRLVLRARAQPVLARAIIRLALPHLAPVTTRMAPVAWHVLVAYPAPRVRPQVPWAASQVHRVPIRAQCEPQHGLRLELVLVVPELVLVVLALVLVVPVALVVPVVPVALVALVVPVVPVALVVPVASAVALVVLVAVLVAVLRVAPEAVDVPVPVDEVAQQEHSVARVANRHVAASPSALSVKSSTTCVRQKSVAYASRVDWVK